MPEIDASLESFLHVDPISPDRVLSLHSLPRLEEVALRLVAFAFGCSELVVVVPSALAELQNR